MPSPARVPAPLEPDDLQEIGRGLVTTARQLIEPDAPVPFGSTRLGELLAALRSMREVQKLHRAAKRSLREDEVWRLRMDRERLLNAAARANRGAAIARFRIALDREKAGWSAKRLIEKRERHTESLTELAEANTQAVKTRTRIAEERHDADYPIIDDEIHVTEAALPEAQSAEAYLLSKAPREPEGGGPLLDAEPRGECDSPRDCGGPVESDADRAGTSGESGAGGAT